MTAIRLIVGLAIPGANTKPPAQCGFLVGGRTRAPAKLSFKSEAKFHGLTARGQLHGHEVLLLKPQTFMNVSGRAVGALAQFYKSNRRKFWWCMTNWICRPAWRA